MTQYIHIGRLLYIDEDNTAHTAAARIEIDGELYGAVKLFWRFFWIV